MSITGSSQEERNGATITFVLTGLFGWLGGLIGWLVWRNKGSYALEQTTEALNFGLTTLLGFIVIRVLSWIIPMIHSLWVVLWVVQLVLSIMAAVAANKGERYRYPYALRLVQ